MRRAHSIAPGVRFVALTASTDRSRCIDALRTGASGYIRRDAGPEVLLEAVRTVPRGGRFVDPAMLHVPAEDTLTPRESVVVRLID